ncbi:MAG TPA: hypothetical protein DCY81_08315 [Lachnospiraceae bacterium]|nr:hypothetical protein [Lachnospiraceae bacterium]
MSQKSINQENDNTYETGENGSPKKVKKYSRGTYIIGIAVFSLIALLVFVSNFKTIFQIYDDISKKINEGEELKEDDYVTFSLNQGYYIKAYAEADYKLYGVIPSGRVYYYLVQLKNGKYISVSARRNLATKIDNIISGKSDENVKISGQLEKLNDQIQVYYNKTISSFALNDEDSEGVFNLTIDATEKSTSTILLICASLVMALFFTLLLVRSYKKLQ